MFALARNSIKTCFKNGCELWKWFVSERMLEIEILWLLFGGFNDFFPLWMCKIIDGKLQFTTIILFWVVNMQYASDVRICRSNRLILSAALHHSHHHSQRAISFYNIFCILCFSVAFLPSISDSRNIFTSSRLHSQFTSCWNPYSCYLLGLFYGLCVVYLFFPKTSKLNLTFSRSL